MDASGDPLAGHESIGGEEAKTAPPSAPVAAAPAPVTPVVDPLAGHASISAGEAAPSDYNHQHPILHGMGYIGQELFHGAAQSLSLPHTMTDYLEGALSHLPGLGFMNPDIPIKGKSGATMTPSEMGITPEKVEGAWQGAGLNSLSPQNPIEEWAGSFARGVGATASTLPVGGMAQPVANLAIGGLGAIGADIGHIVAPDSRWAPVVGALALALTGGKAVSYLSAAADARSTLNQLKSTTAQLAEAKLVARSAKGASADLRDTEEERLLQIRSGHDAAIQGVEASQRSLRDQSHAAYQDLIDRSSNHVQGALQSIDQAQSAAQSAHEAAGLAPKTQATTTLDSLANARTSELDPDKIGQVVKAQGHNFLASTLPKAEDQVWSPLMQVMAHEPAPMDNTLARVEGIAQRGGAVSDAINKIAPNIGRVLSKSLVPETDQAAKDIGLGLPEPTFKDLKEFRSTVGAARGGQTPIKGVSDQDWDSIYQAATSDMQRAAEGRGLGKEFDQANSTSKSLRDFADGPVAALVHGPKPDPRDLAGGEVVNKLLSQAKNTGETLQALRAEPSTARATDELAGHVLRLAQDSPKAWTELAPGAQVALVPDQLERIQINQALAAKGGEVPKFDSAPFDAQRQDVQAAHEIRVSQYRGLQDQASTAYTQAVKEAKDSERVGIMRERRARSAEARGLEANASALQDRIDELRASQSPLINTLHHGVEALVGAEVGEPISSMATHLLGVSGVPHSVSRGIAAATPWMWRQLSHALSHPGQTLNQVIRGGVQGATPNPLGGGEGEGGTGGTGGTK